MIMRQKKHGLTVALQIVLILMLSLLLFGILTFEIARTESVLRREAAASAALACSISATGYVFRDECLLESVDGGPVVYEVSDGTAVLAGDAIALVYADGGNTGTRARAAGLTAEIERLQAIDSPSVPDYYGAYRSLMQSLSDSAVLGTKGEIDTLVAALDRHAAQAEEEGERAARIAALQAEFDKLIENDRNATDRVSAPNGGVFLREVDGYESVMTTEAVKTLTPGGLRALLASAQDTPLAVGRIVTGGVWYLAVPLDAERADAFVTGEAYPVTVSRTGERPTLTLERITAPDTGGEVLLIFCAAEGTPLPADLSRSQEVVLTVGTVSGIWVPMMALREENGRSLVLVEENGVAVSRTVEVVYKGDGYCLSALTEQEGCLREGDKILITPRRIYHGRVLV